MSDNWGKRFDKGIVIAQYPEELLMLALEILKMGDMVICPEFVNETETSSPLVGTGVYAGVELEP